MRKFALLLFVLAAFTATAATKRFESRSDRHALTVDVEDDTYRVNVVEVASSSVILSASFPIHSKAPMNAESKLPDGEVRVLLRVLDPPGISATVDVSKGNTIVDSFASAWSMAPLSVRSAPPSNPNSPLSSRYPEAKRVGGDVKAPVVIKRAAPYYPPEARRDNVSGTVIIESVVDRNGDVKDAVVLKDIGYGLGAEALAALKKWKFKPATENGEPVDVLFNLTIDFKLGARR